MKLPTVKTIMSVLLAVGFIGLAAGVGIGTAFLITVVGVFLAMLLLVVLGPD